MCINFYYILYIPNSEHLQLQNAFHKHITSKGFDLEKDLPVE